MKDNKKKYQKFKKKYQKLKKILLKNQKFEILAHSLAGLCHEIRNLITPVILLEFIQEEVKTEYKQHIQKILDMKNQILTLTEDVRTFYSHSKAERISILEIEKIIQDSIYFYELTQVNREKHIKIQIINHLQEEDYFFCIEVRKDQLIQVFINLIKNAGDVLLEEEHNEKISKITLKIKKNLKFLYISTIDNGTGIKEEHLKKIWAPQFSTKKNKGMGLGLYIVKIIIDQFKGKIFCKNRSQKKGCNFTIKLPLFNLKKIL